MQSHLKSLKIKGGSEPHLQNFLKLCQKLRLIMLIKLKVVNIKKKITVLFLNHKPLKAVIKGVFSTVAMVTYCATELTPRCICSPTIGEFCDTMIVASTDMELL